ncbi:MAG: aminotransferase class V-fold PLP-dependent enzyme [Deltaproteobacteria bacterium]|nr:MAG: aminotransferase class V-fold PLP-dependent enzyme [Deltaproteobacteria bacterium]
MPASRAVVLANHLVLQSGGRLSSASVALIRRTLAGLARAGVRDVAVVDGHHAAELRAALGLHELPALRVTVLENRSWRTASGATARLARPFAGDEPVLVLRGDRPLDDEALAELAASDLDGAVAAIAIAAVPDAPAVGLADEPKVRLRPGARREVAAIGLDLDPCDAVFTGHLLAAPELFDALDALPNPALEDALAEVLAAGGRVLARPGHVAWLWGGRQPAPVDDQVEALLGAKSHPRYHLLNPGPVNTTARVKSALVHPDVCHRDAAFSELMVSLTGKLRRIFRASPRHTIALITGSGTAAMECALASTVPRDRKVLVVDNGAFGERFLEVARVHDMDVVHLRYAWGDVVDPADVRRALERDPEIAVVAMVHHETSVGLLNPVREVGALCREYGALFVVDAVSSLGAEDLDVVRDGIDVCYASANKCLHAVSGVGFVCVAPDVWPRIEHIKPRSYYLDLKRYRYYADELAQTPFTPAVSAYFALDAACAEFLADGHAARFALYRRRNAKLRAGLAALGMAPFTRTGCESHSVVTCCVPDGVTFDELYAALRARGFIVYACKDVLADKFMQVANMGDLDDDTIDAFLTACGEEIARIRAAKAVAGGAELPPARAARA